MPGIVLGARETKIKIQDLSSQRLWLRGQIETKTTAYTMCWQVSTRHTRTQKGRQQMCLKRAGKPHGRVTLNGWRRRSLPEGQGDEMTSPVSWQQVQRPRSKRMPGLSVPPGKVS